MVKYTPGDWQKEPYQRVWERKAVISQYYRSELLNYSSNHKRDVAKYLLEIGYGIMPDYLPHYKFLFNNTKPKPNPYGLSDHEIGKIRFPLVNVKDNAFETIASFIFKTLKYRELENELGRRRIENLLDHFADGTPFENEELDLEETNEECEAFAAVLLKEIYGISVSKEIDPERYERVYEKYKGKIEEVVAKDANLPELLGISAA